MLNLVLAVGLCGAAIAIVLYLAAILYFAASEPFSGFVERQRFNLYATRARHCDELIKRGDTKSALRALGKAFYLHTVHDRSLSSSVANHHTALLSRAISLTAEAQGGTVRLLSLAKADRLLSERSELQRRYFSALQSDARPKAQALAVSLQTNAQELRAALSQLVDEVDAAGGTRLLH